LLLANFRPSSAPPTHSAHTHRTIAAPPSPKQRIHHRNHV
jgi:hypothetical protein